MTDRYKGVVVSFDHDIREDDAESLIVAIRMIRGVLSVDPVVADVNDIIIRSRVDFEWRVRLYSLLK